MPKRSSHNESSHNESSHKESSAQQVGEVAKDLHLHLPPLPPSGRVGILGGSFNPPHIAHALLAHAVLSCGTVDAIWVLPCADHPFGKSLAPFDQRLEMCRRGFRNLKATEVVDVEQRLPMPSFTVQTLRALKAAQPALKPSWIVGSDILGEIDRWREPDVLRTLCEVLVIPRAGHVPNTADDTGHDTAALKFALPEVSSTEIRATLARGEDAKGWLDAEVRVWIAQHGLYTSNL